MKIRLKKEHENAVIPTYSKEGDCGMDLTAVSKIMVSEKDHGYIEYDTGIALEIPPNFVGLIFPRGSISHTGLILANAVGVSDSNYRGTLKARFKWIPGTKQYEVGERIAQLIILPHPSIEWDLTNELSHSARGDKAFGSSGN